MKICEITGKTAPGGQQRVALEQEVQEAFQSEPEDETLLERGGRPAGITLKVTAHGMKNHQQGKGLAAALKEAAAPKSLY